MRRSNLNYLAGFERIGPFLNFLLVTLSYTLVIIILLRIVFPLTYGDNGDFNYQRAYTILAITLISGIPFLTGSLFGFIIQSGVLTAGPENTAGNRVDYGNIIRTGVVVSSILTFVLAWVSMYLTDPVSTEGWLRTLFVSFLLAILSPLVLILSSVLISWRLPGIVVIIIMLFLTLTLPVGLLMNHPWSYLAFFSPFYWTGWAWVVPEAGESLIYGIISFAISLIIFFLIYRRLSFRKS